MDRPILSRRARWAVPAAAVAAVGAVAAGALVTTAQASPVLPVRTSAQLLAAVSGRDATLAPFTGTVAETASLGLPDLPGVDSPTSVTSLLTGSHTMKIWYANPTHLRLSVPGAMTESDLFVNGRTAWYWQSTGNQVTKFLLPANSARSATTKVPRVPELTPAQAARQALAAVGPSTTVSLQRNVMVAGQAAYQLVLAPKSASSLVGRVRIAVDGTRYIPLRVQVFARGASSPAFQVGFTSISYVQPAASNFSFTPPPGSKVTTQTLSGPSRARRSVIPSGPKPRVFGTDWLTVAELPSADLSGALAGMAGHSSSAMLKGSSSAAVGGAESSAAQSVSGGAPGGSPGGLDAAGLFGLAMRSASQVHGSWGSGRLLRTSLLSMLMTNDGRVFLGAVSPSVLYHDATLAK